MPSVEPTAEPASAQIVPNTGPEAIQTNAPPSYQGYVMCPHCHNNVIPVLVIRRSSLITVAAVMSCLLCMIPCAIFLLCCPCGILTEYYCPMCGGLIRSE